MSEEINEDNQMRTRQMYCNHCGYSYDVGWWGGEVICPICNQKMSERDERSEALKALSDIRSYVEHQADYYAICSKHEARSKREAEIYDACKGTADEILSYVYLVISGVEAEEEGIAL